MDQQNPNPAPRFSKRVVISALAILLLIIAGAALLNVRYNDQKNRNQAGDGQNNQPQREVDKFPPVPAPQGQIVEGFPDPLLAGSKEIVSSSSRDYGNGVKLLNGEFTLDKTERQAFDYYIQYLTDNNYQITNDEFGTKFGTSTISSIYGVGSGGEQVNIVITNKGDANAKPVTVSISVSPAVK